MLYLWLVPSLILIATGNFVFWNLRIAYYKNKQKDKSTSHSERVYRAFEFFFTIAVAIIGAFGYLRINEMSKNPSVVRPAMTGLALLLYLSSIFLIIAVTVHLGSKFERWGQNTEKWKHGIHLNEWWRWVEPWMMIFAYILATAIWVLTFIWK
jgi:uncharacterized membrane protein